MSGQWCSRPGGQRSEKGVEADERKPAGRPTAKELAQQKLGSRQRFGEQRKQGAIFPLHGDLPSGGRNCDDQ